MEKQKSQAQMPVESAWQRTLQQWSKPCSLPRVSPWKQEESCLCAWRRRIGSQGNSRFLGNGQDFVIWRPQSLCVIVSPLSSFVLHKEQSAVVHLFFRCRAKLTKYNKY